MSLLRVVAGLLLMATVVGAVILLAAGRVDLPFVWAYLGLFLIFGILGGALMDPQLRRERVKPGAGGRDRHLRLMALPLMVAHWVLAGLDLGRWHLTDTIPLWLRAAGLAGLALCFGLVTWAVAVNRFFSPVIRIQQERGHVLVTDGPYRLLRHPGYAASLGMTIFGAIALGSWIALAPLVPVMALIVRRAVIEDRFLHEHLEGYSGYARRTRFRLVPGLW